MFSKPICRGSQKSLHKQYSDLGNNILLFLSVAFISIAFVWQSALAEETYQPINLEYFEGHENWPIVSIGEMPADSSKLKDQRIIFKAKFPGAQGLKGPLEDTTMMFDVANVFFRGRPALWIQWLSTGKLDAVPGTASIDYLIVDRKTHRTMHRVQSLGGMTGPPSWAGPFSIQNYTEKNIFNTVIAEDGSSSLKKLEDIDAGTINFAALPFWLPFIDLEAGKNFRVPYYSAQLNEVIALPIHVEGLRKIEDANGRQHEVWNVQAMSVNGAALTVFWISKKAPYFLGWDFRLASGKPISVMDYKKHWVLNR